MPQLETNKLQGTRLNLGGVTYMGYFLGNALFPHRISEARPAARLPACLPVRTAGLLLASSKCRGRGGAACTADAPALCAQAFQVRPDMDHIRDRPTTPAEEQAAAQAQAQGEAAAAEGAPGLVPVNVQARAGHSLLAAPCCSQLACTRLLPRCLLRLLRRALAQPELPHACRARPAGAAP